MRRVLACLLVCLLTACGPTDPEPGQQVGEVVEKKKDFFTHDKMFFIRIEGWDPDRMTPASLADEQQVAGAVLKIYESNADSPKHCPDGDGELVYQSDAFRIRTSGNLTNGTPKSSYKIKLDGEQFVKMKTLNLKSMWNDVSQMREAIAWELFEKADVPASRHAYARFCINDRYYGLYSVIEQVDKRMLKDHFGKLDEGNVYKAYWSDEDLGPADLRYQGSEGGDYYANEDIDARTYRLQSNEDDDQLNSYDDLATLITIINGRHASDVDFDSPEFEQAIEKVFDVPAFLRWAGVNILLGAWDNYWGSPANYYLYNSGVEQDGDFVAEPFFTWIPWDYDNSLGIDYFGVPWQKVGIYDWAKHTRTEARELPLITNLLKNKRYLAYYLDHMECMMGRYFNTAWVEKRIGNETKGLWALIDQSVFLEADGPQHQPHTGRQFTNDQVYWNGFRHHEISKDGQFTMGIWHYVNARRDSAASQIAGLRAEHDLTPPATPVCN